MQIELENAGKHLCCSQNVQYIFFQRKVDKNMNLSLTLPMTKVRGFLVQRLQPAIQQVLHSLPKRIGSGVSLPTKNYRLYQQTESFR